MQIWKSPYMFVFMQKQCLENFAFLILRILELFAREACKSRLIFNIFFCFWMFVNKSFTYLSRALISESKRCFNLKSSTYYFHIKTKISADFQICISVPLKITVWKTSIVHIWSFLVHIIPAFGLNARKYEPEKLQIGTLFTHWKSKLI